MLNKKAKERTAGNLLTLIKYGVGKARAQVRVTVESKMLTLGKSSEWLEWTQENHSPDRKTELFGLGTVVCKTVNYVRLSEGLRS